VKGWPSVIWHYLHATWIPFVLFVLIGIGVPILGFLHDRRHGKPPRAWTVVGYIALGLVLGAVLAGSLVTPPELRQPLPPPRMR
jgi:MFS family permease